MLANKKDARTMRSGALICGQQRAERRAAPKPARIPSGDRPAYPPDEGPSSGAQSHGAAVPGVELLHAVFHRRLVRARLVVTTLVQGLAARIHTQRDLVVLDAGLEVRGLLSLDE